jgi:uncharacterized RDD family membrane protein YckC
MVIKRRGQIMPYCKNCGNELPEGAQFCPRCGTAVAKPEEQVVKTPVQQPTPSGPRLAFWGERFVAWLIDVVIIGGILGIINLFAFLGGLSFNLIPGWPNWIPFFSFNSNGIFLFLYWMFMEGSNGQSVGKMVMRLKIVHVDGTTVNMGNAAVESVGKAFLLPLDCIVGWILYPRSRQRLFSHISRTTVVKMD